MPFGREDKVKLRVDGAMVRLTGPLVVSTGVLESVAFTAMVAVPATVGVPLTTQPETVSPAGSAPAVIAQE